MACRPGWLWVRALAFQVTTVKFWSRPRGESVLPTLSCECKPTKFFSEVLFRPDRVKTEVRDFVNAPFDGGVVSLVIGLEQGQRIPSAHELVLTLERCKRVLGVEILTDLE